MEKLNRLQGTLQCFGDLPSDRAQELKEIQERLAISISDSEAISTMTSRIRSLKERLSNSPHPSTPTEEDSDSDETVRGETVDPCSLKKEEIERLEELLLGQQMDFDAQIDLLLEDKMDLMTKLGERDEEIKRLIAELNKQKQKTHELLNETW